ncbi:MAG: HAD family hydrolase [Candidatus Promineifilaceae bacterium]|jgi:HAD superfamily hydrolase (TIGR01549 family)
MIKAILLDLDNTLLGNDMDVFLPHYFDLCGTLGERHLPREAFMQALLGASRTMVQNIDPARTNNEVFWDQFNGLSGLDSDVIEADFDRFYHNEFEQLRQYTQPSPLAKRLVNASFARRLSVVIATNPMFPRQAIETRLQWAGVPVSEYPYALVTTMENMHATKPQAAYYQEILDAVGCGPEEALMVGDDVRHDIAPAAAMGLFTYWIELPGAELPPGLRPTAQGSLEKLVLGMESGWLSSKPDLP